MSKLNKMVTYTGRHIINDISATFTNNVGLNPLVLDPRLVTVSDAFQEFRFTRVNVHVLYGGAAPQPWALAYTPVIPTAAVGSTGFTDLAGMAAFSAGSGIFGSPFPHLKLGKKILAQNAPKWFRRGTAYDDLLEVQGYIYYSNLLSGIDQVRIVLVIDYTIQLQAPSTTSLTMRAAHAPQSMVDALARVRSTLPDELKDDDDQSEEPVDLTPLFRRDGMVVVPHMQSTSPATSVSRVKGKKS